MRMNPKQLSPDRAVKLFNHNQLLVLLALALLSSGCAKDFTSAKESSTETETKITKHQSTEPSKLNRLKDETSPYLRQHADNPVDWYPWGEEAFTRAKKENKPILLSVGYSACHWCHVMEHESFEDPATAEIMNKNFVNIKVDREERPDVDAIYMKVVTKMTGSGGWPMTVFLTPELKPFFAGTYFPKETKGGMPPFKKVLRQLASKWKKDRKNLVELSDKMVEVISVDEFESSSPAGNNKHILGKSVEHLLEYSDDKWGGLGGSQKFPYPCVLGLLSRATVNDSTYSEKTRTDARAYLKLTLNKMAMGGVYDQIGGGFFRYSTDSKWMIPHFEKMLYDNAMLSSAYLDGFKRTKNQYWAATARETIDFVIRELGSPQGYFYSSLDADSEGEEGKYYVFTASQIDKVLGPKEGQFARDVYGVTGEGNFENGKTVLHLTESPDKLVKKYKITVTDFHKKIMAANGKLLAYRNQRVRPGRDEKMLTCWNALMISSLVKGYSVLKKPEYLEKAKECARFLLDKQISKAGLLRTHSNGKSHIPAYLDDYAYFVKALLDLAEVDPDSKWLKNAIKLNDEMLSKFWDDKSGSFYFASNDHKNLIIKTRMSSDGSTPAGTSVATMNLLRLSQLLDKKQFKEKADSVLRYYAGAMASNPDRFAYLLSAMDFRVSQKSEIVIVSDSKMSKAKTSKASQKKLADNFEQMLFALGEFYLPDTVILASNSGFDSSLPKIPLLKGRKSVGGKSTVYFCENYNCKLPITDVLELENTLKQRSGSKKKM